MSAHPAAAIFDLDDTLYRERRFILSGFRTVAVTLADGRTDRASAIFAFLASALRRGQRATALQRLCEAQRWPESKIPELVALIRNHRPALRLPASSVRALEQLRPRWRLAVVTNGPAEIQHRKVRALGLDARVDAVIYATEYGSGRGKPEPEPFLAACARLGVEPARTVFVGDDPAADLQGAQEVGMRTIGVCRVAHDVERSAPRGWDAVVRSVAEVPPIAERLLETAYEPCA